MDSRDTLPREPGDREDTQCARLWTVHVQGSGDGQVRVLDYIPAPVEMPIRWCMKSGSN